jgi:hypothetical protein
MPAQGKNSGKICKTLRLNALSTWLIEGMTRTEMALKLGVSVPTIDRLLASRKKQFLATLNERQIETFNFLVRNSLDDFASLGEQIAESEKFSLVVTDAYGKRAQIARNLARFLGIESTIKVQNNNIQLNDNRKQVSMNGPVQIIIEQNGSGFDPEFGSVRMDSPSADEISSATGE